MIAAVLLILAQLVIVGVAGLFESRNGPGLPASVRALVAFVLALVVPSVLGAWLLLLGIGVQIGALLSAALLLAAAAWWWRLSSATVQVPDPWWYVALLVIPVVAPVVVQVWGAALKPEASIDGLLYHGTALANIVSNDSLFGWEAGNQYLYFSDLQLVLAAMWSALTRTVMLEDAVQGPFFGLAVLSLYVASAVTGRNRALRMWLSLIVVITPVMWTQGRVLYVDVASAALFIAGVALTVAALRTQAARLFVVAAAAMGASVATKPSAMFAGAITMALIWAVIAWSRRWPILLVSIASFALAALPFYLRNVISFGNPFYPIATSLGPLQFPGIVESARFNPSGTVEPLLNPMRLVAFGHNLFVGIRSGTPRWLYDPREGGFDRTPVILLAFVLLSAIVMLLAGRRSGSTAARLDRPWWFLPVVALASVTVQPNPTDARYMMAAYLCLSAAGISLVAILPSGIAPELGLVAVAALTSVALVVLAEQRMLFGISESLKLRAQAPSYNTGLDGNTVAYGDAYSWLQGTSCPTVVIQTLGGLTPAGMPGEGLMGTFNYPAWGDELCNTVEFVPTPDLEQAAQVITSEGVRAQVRDADFLVIKDDSAQIWQQVLEQEGLDATEVGGFDATEYYKEGETVFALSGEPSNAQ